MKNAIHGPYDFPAPVPTISGAQAHNARRAAKAKALNAIRAGECPCERCEAAGATIPLPTSDMGAGVREGGRRALSAGWTWYSPGLGKPTYILARGGTT